MPYYALIQRESIFPQKLALFSVEGLPTEAEAVQKKIIASFFVFIFWLNFLCVLRADLGDSYPQKF